MTSIRNIQSQMADVYGEFRDIYTRLPVSTVKKLFSEIRRIREDAINSGKIIAVTGSKSLLTHEMGL